MYVKDFTARRQERKEGREREKEKEKERTTTTTKNYWYPSWLNAYFQCFRGTLSMKPGLSEVQPLSLNLLLLIKITGGCKPTPPTAVSAADTYMEGKIVYAVMTGHSDFCP